MPPSVGFVAVAALVGLVVGSYLNVLIHRLPRGESTVLPRSRCPGCDAPIAARDNVPVLSYLWLRGRCRRCRSKISWRYPLVEATTGTLFALVALRHGPTGRTASEAVFVTLLVALAWIDVEHFLLPDKLTLPGIALGLALQPWLPVTLLDAALGALTGAGLLILLINTWYWLRSEEGMGLGDVNLLAMIGAFLGWQGMLVTLLLGAAAGALFGLGAIALRRLEVGSKLPFGTFLAVGALVALFFGEAWVAAYTSLL